VAQSAGSASGFSDVDRATDPARLIELMNVLRANPGVAAAERDSFAALAVQPGHRLLDAGCGPGDVAAALAELAGSGGRVVGVDASAGMVAEARRRVAGRGLPVDFEVGDVHRLNFEDGAFDGCRAERLLMHVQEPGQALRELARVTRPGGRVAATDFDWDTLVVDHPDRALTRDLVALRAGRIRNGWIGRQLPRLCREAGLAEVEVTGRVVPFRDLATAERFMFLAQTLEQARGLGLASAAEAAAWWQELVEAEHAGTFFCGLVLLTVAARRP
jgi:ubiquinone/menaquinone biosynthesis C-methylase UbiE